MLQRALASVYSQTLLPVEVLLIIDEPTDFQKYSFLARYDKRLRVTFTGGGKGGAAARNIGLDQVSADYVFFLDDDDEWMEEKCERQMEVFLTSDRNIIGVSCNRIIHNVSMKRETRITQQQVDQYGTQVNLIGSFSFFGLRWDQRTLGLRLDEELDSAQDLEYYIRLLKIGRILLVEDALAIQHCHEGPRISGNWDRKLRATRHIFNKHKQEFSLRENYWYRARIRAFRGLVASGKLSCTYHLWVFLLYAATLGWKDAYRPLLRKWTRLLLQNLARGHGA